MTDAVVTMPFENQKLDNHISVVVPISDRRDDILNLYRDYEAALTESTKSFDFIFVLDGDFNDTFARLQEMRAEFDNITIIRLARQFGESTALNAGFEHATGELILTLPPYYQIEPSALPALIRSFHSYDMIIGRRWPRTDSLLNRIGTRLFHRIIRLMTGYTYRDLGCGVRLIRHDVVENVTLYGDLHRFLPVLANYYGYTVKEVSLPQSKHDPRVRLYRPGIYFRRMLDLFAVFFVVKFTKKPLRFFGLVGGTLAIIGGVLLSGIAYQRLFLDVALGNRPALLLSTLLIVLGTQLIALGLIGELIIFTHARELREYHIAEIVN